MRRKPWLLPSGQNRAKEYASVTLRVMVLVVMVSAVVMVVITEAVVHSLKNQPKQS